jgi:ABC-type dipeptide/oligopeptide/nickel transport system permease component
MAETAGSLGQVPGPTATVRQPRRRGSLERWAILLARRLAWGVVVLFAIATVTFFLTHYVPSDPAVYLAGPNATTETVNKIREQFGLDEPAYVQYVRYMENLARGDLGISLFSQRPVSEDLIRSLPVTLGLIVPAFIVYVLLATVLGCIAAYGAGRTRSVVIQVATMTVSAAPVYWLALVLQFFFFFQFPILPSGGQYTVALGGPTPITNIAWLDSILTWNIPALGDALWHIVLPMTTIVLGLLAVGTRLMAGAVREELDKVYVRTARGKGLPESKILLKHVLRATINPFVTVTGIQFGYLITYTILVEVVFTWPGMGYYLEQSIRINDYAPLIGVTMVAAAGFVLISIVSDIIYHLVDPRIELS